MKKRICLMVLALMLMATVSHAAVLSLKATWTPNTDAVTTGYKLYRTDGTRTLIGTIAGKTSAQFPFTVTVADGTSGTLKFVLTATSATAESADSVTVSYPFNLAPVPPTVPVGLGISPQ